MAKYYSCRFTIHPEQTDLQKKLCLATPTVDGLYCKTHTGVGEPAVKRGRGRPRKDATAKPLDRVLAPYAIADIALPRSVVEVHAAKDCPAVPPKRRGRISDIDMTSEAFQAFLSKPVEKIRFGPLEPEEDAAAYAKRRKQRGRMWP